MLRPFAIKTLFVFCRTFKRLFFCCGYSERLEGGPPLSTIPLRCPLLFLFVLASVVLCKALCAVGIYPTDTNSKADHRPLHGQTGHKESRGSVSPRLCRYHFHPPLKDQIVGIFFDSNPRKQFLRNLHVLLCAFL